MHSPTRRTSLRAGAAAGLLTAGALAFASPAYAGGAADLGIELSGTTLAATTSGKVADITVTNHGPGTASGVVVGFDLSRLETDKVALEVPDAKACNLKGATLTCGVVDIAPGEALDLGVRLTRKAGTGPAGSLAVAVKHEGVDAKPTNDVDTAEVAVAGSGPDLYAYAPDVPFDPKTGKVGTVRPGSTTELVYEVGNTGDQAVSGVVLKIRLPKHATFTEVEPECKYNPAKTEATCKYEDLPLVPADEDTDGRGGVISAARFKNLVSISKSAPAAALTGGSVSVEGLVAEQEQAPAQRQARRSAPTLPSNAVDVPAMDVDDSDNTDEFVIHVADTSGGGGGDGLPVTGVKAGLIGGVGLGVLVGGGVLLLFARRRRVVLVNPTDEIPTA